MRIVLMKSLHMQQLISKLRYYIVTSLLYITLDVLLLTDTIVYSAFRFMCGPTLKKKIGPLMCRGRIASRGQAIGKLSKVTRL